jgi:WD40 repeat protein
MWPGAKFTSLSDSLFTALFKFLFRYDIFISYARSDGKEYALKLRDQLKQLDFTCFLDYEELPPGNSLNATLKRALRKSAALVIVGTERAVKSRYVELEVGEFAKTGRAIIPIDIEGTLSDAPWQIIKERDIVWIDEMKAALGKGVPSPNVADSIDKLFKYTRRNSRVRAQVLSTILLFVVVVAVSIFMIRQQVNAATLASAEAERQKVEAKSQKEAAEKASAEAAEQRKAASEAIRRADVAKGEADAARDRASVAEKAASDAALEAKEQERKALANAERARKEQARAEERTRYIRAQQLGVQAEIAVSQGKDTEQGVLLSIESLMRAFTPEGYAAWARGMELLPRPVETGFARDYKNVSAMAYSPDGRLFVSGGKDGAVTLFQTDGASQPVELQPRLKKPVIAITFVNHGEQVAAATENDLSVWDLKTFRQVESMEKFGGRSFAISPDGRYVAIAGSSTGALLRVVDTASDAILVETEEGVGYEMSLAFSPNGRWLAATSFSTTISFWDVAKFKQGVEANRQPATSITDAPDFKYVSFSPKGNYLAAEIPDGAAKVWRVDYAQETIELSEFSPSQKWIRTRGQESPWSLVFSPDESYIATTPDSKTALIWEVSTEREIARIGHENSVEALAFSADGRLLATASDGIKFWETRFGSDAWRLTRADKTNFGAKALAVSPGGEWLVAGSEDGVRVFRTADWSLAITLNVGPVSRLTFSPDGQWLVAAGQDEVRVLFTKQWKVLKVIPHPLDLSFVGFSHNSHWLVATHHTGLRLFEADSWRELPQITATGDIGGVAFSPDSRLIAAQVAVDTEIAPGLGGSKGEIELWDVASQMHVGCKDDKGNQSLRDSLILWKEAFCSGVKAGGEQVLLSQIVGWRELSQANDVSSASPDGRWSAEVGGRWFAEGREGVNLIFNEGKTSRYVATLTRASAMNTLTFTPDSRWLVIAGDDRVAVWPLKPCDMIKAAYARLRRRVLNDDERRVYISEENSQPTCPQNTLSNKIARER